MRRRAIFLLAAMAVVLLLTSGVALAANLINCADDAVITADPSLDSQSFM